MERKRRARGSFAFGNAASARRRVRGMCRLSPGSRPQVSRIRTLAAHATEADGPGNHASAISSTAGWGEPDHERACRREPGSGNVPSVPGVSHFAPKPAATIRTELLISHFLTLVLEFSKVGGRCLRTGCTPILSSSAIRLTRGSVSPAYPLLRCGQSSSASKLRSKLASCCACIRANAKSSR